MKTKFTKGPWDLRGTLKNGGQLEMIRIGPDERLTALCPIFGEESANANAHLVSAAPDLYASLEEVLGMQEDGPKDYAAIVLRAVNALKKARGEK